MQVSAQSVLKSFAFISLAFFVMAALARTAADDIAAVDVAGVRLGAAPGDIVSAASAQGLKETARNKAPSFRQAVAATRGRIIPPKDFDSVQRLLFASGGESLEVLFVQTKAGAEAATITYKRLGGVAREAFRETVFQKYGPPDQEIRNVFVWGDARAKFLRTEPYLEYDAAPPSATGERIIGSLTLRDPKAVERSHQAVVAAAIER